MNLIIYITTSMFLKPCVSKWLPVNFPVTETFKFSVFGNALHLCHQKEVKQLN